jgi:regulator of protease activity HflC (stomatin/prohibitin superfamily)
MSRLSRMGCVAGGLLGTTLIVAATLVVFFLHRVDPGNVGVIINYNVDGGKPTTQVVYPGNFQFINPFSGTVFHEYPIAQQTLSMTATQNEGEISGNDSVTCQDVNGVNVALDVTALWQVDPGKAATLYFLRPNQDLKGSFNNDIESTIVRPVLRNAITIACSAYSWDTMASNKTAIAQQALALAQPKLAFEGIIILDSNLYINDIPYSESQQAAINAKSNAQQQSEQAKFLLQKAQYEAQAAIAKAQGDAKAIEIINSALANNPNYLQYYELQKWDGHLPQVVGSASVFASLGNH